MLLNNRYQVIQILGVGGFSETFLAEDTYMPSHRRCVIKQLKPITKDPQTYEVIQQRFEREAATLEYLGEGSDQIPKLYAYFCENEQFYLVQEWIQGRTLSNIMKVEGSLGETEVKEILLSLLSVLIYIHSKGIIHRDIKPDNIILRNPPSKSIPPYPVGDRLVLIDFGAVKATVHSLVNPLGFLTQSLVMGTPGYMSSEQAAGRPVYATDIYSLGLTAIYLLTGKHPQQLPVNPRTGEIFWQHYAPRVSPNLARVLSRAIQPQASQRYTTAGKMLRALKSVQTQRLFLPLPFLKTKHRNASPQPSQISQPVHLKSSPSLIAATPSTISQSPAGASQLQTQLLSSTQNTPTLIYSVYKNWQKPAWIVGSLMIASLVAAVAVVTNIHKPEPEVTIATAPTSQPISESQTTNPIPVPATPPPAPPENDAVIKVTPVFPQSAPLPEQENQTPTVFRQQPRIAPKKSVTATSTPQVPGFPTGTPRTTVEAALGTPARDSRGFWRNTRAISYVLVPKQIELGYLFDRGTGKLRQTEVAFAQSVDFQVQLATVEEILGGEITGEIRRGMLKIYQRNLNDFSFTLGALKGQIIRQECGLIYISVWDADLHDFVRPADARRC